MVREKDKRRIKPAFELGGVTIPINKIQPTKVLPKSTVKSMKYKQTETSIREIGIIEPPIVFREQDPDGNYMLLDGHMRMQILENMGETEVFCLLSIDDEAYTYNKMVNRVSPVMEHVMIEKAMKSGLTEEEVAKNLGVDIKQIRKKRNLLNGICPEAVELLKKRDVPATTFKVLRKMKSMRQIQTAELMLGANNFSSTFATALLVMTPPGQRERPSNSGKDPENGLSPEQMASMETELAHLESEYKQAEENLGEDMLIMVAYRGYLTRLLENKEVEEYLAKHDPDVLHTFKGIIKRAATDAFEF